MPNLVLIRLGSPTLLLRLLHSIPHILCTPPGQWLIINWFIEASFKWRVECQLWKRPIDQTHLYLNLLPLKKMLLLDTVFIWLDLAHLGEIDCGREGERRRAQKRLNTGSKLMGGQCMNNMWNCGHFVRGIISNSVYNVSPEFCNDPCNICCS